MREPIVFKIEFDKDMKFSLNKVWWGCHFSVRSKARNYWHDAIEECVKEKKIEPIDYQVEVDTIFFFKTRYLDSSNCSAMHKMVEDWLVKNNIFKDDTNKYIRRISLMSALLKEDIRKKFASDFVIVRIKEFIPDDNDVLTKFYLWN